MTVDRQLHSSRSRSHYCNHVAATTWGVRCRFRDKVSSTGFILSADRSDHPNDRANSARPRIIDLFGAEKIGKTGNLAGCSGLYISHSASRGSEKGTKENGAKLYDLVCKGRISHRDTLASYLVRKSRTKTKEARMMSQRVAYFLQLRLRMIMKLIAVISVIAPAWPRRIASIASAYRLAFDYSILCKFASRRCATYLSQQNEIKASDKLRFMKFW